jgi:hypothetical protein
MLACICMHGFPRPSGVRGLRTLFLLRALLRGVADQRPPHPPPPPPHPFARCALAGRARTAGRGVFPCMLMYAAGGCGCVRGAISRPRAPQVVGHVASTYTAAHPRTPPPTHAPRSADCFFPDCPMHSADNPVANCNGVYPPPPLPPPTPPTHPPTRALTRAKREVWACGAPPRAECPGRAPCPLRAITCNRVRAPGVLPATAPSCPSPQTFRCSVCASLPPPPHHFPPPLPTRVEPAQPPVAHSKKVPGTPSRPAKAVVSVGRSRGTSEAKRAGGVAVRPRQASMSRWVAKASGPFPAPCTPWRAPIAPRRARTAT